MQPHRTRRLVGHTGRHVAVFSRHLSNVVGGSGALRPGEAGTVGATVHMGYQASGLARGWRVHRGVQYTNMGQLSTALLLLLTYL